MKTTAANDRLFMMEKQMTVLSKESRAGKNAFEPTRLFQSGKNSELKIIPGGWRCMIKIMLKLTRSRYFELLSFPLHMVSFFVFGP